MSQPEHHYSSKRDAPIQPPRDSISARGWVRDWVQRMATVRFQTDRVSVNGREAACHWSEHQVCEGPRRAL